MTKIKRIDHIAVVVDDIDEALSFWRDLLGLPLDHIEDVPEQKSLVAFMPAGGSEVELVKPTTDDSGVARFLQKRGRLPGGVESQRSEADQRDGHGRQRRQTAGFHPPIQR
jgi:methylmalonyl-CoA epimerase